MFKLTTILPSSKLFDFSYTNLVTILYMGNQLVLKMVIFFRIKLIFIYRMYVYVCTRYIFTFNTLRPIHLHRDRLDAIVHVKY